MLNYEDLNKEILAALMELPDHLRNSAMVIIRLNKATAEGVAEHTGRSRANESGNLNELERLGYLKREPQGHRVYFKRGDKLKVS